MADKALSYEDILAQARGSNVSTQPLSPAITSLISEPQVMTPMYRPGSMTPAIEPLRGQMTPYEEPGLLSYTAQQFGRGIAETPRAYANLIAALPSFGQAAISPSTYAGLGSYIAQNPLAAAETGLDIIGDVSTRAAGGMLGTALSLPAAARTLALTRSPATAATTLMAGPAMGQAAGGLVWDVAKGIATDAANYIRGVAGKSELPMPEDVPKTLREALGRLAYETPQNVLGEGFEKLSIKAIKAIPKINAAPKAATNIYNTIINKKSDDAIILETAKVLNEVGVDKQKIMTALQNAKYSGNPFAGNATTAELLGDPNLYRIQQFTQESVGGLSPEVNARKAEIYNITNQLDAITGVDTTYAIQLRKDLQTKLATIIEDEKTRFTQTYENILAQGPTHSLYDVAAKLKQIDPNLFSTSTRKPPLASEAKGGLSSNAKTALEFLNPNRGGRVGVTSVTSKELHSVSSTLKEEARDATGQIAETYSSLAKSIDDILYETPIGNDLKKTNVEYRDFAETYAEGAVKSLEDPRVITPENVIEKITANTTAWRDSLAKFKNDPAAIQKIIAITFQEFKELKNIADKRAWIKKQRTNFKETPFNETLVKADLALKNLDEILQNKEQLEDLLPNLDQLESLDLSELAKVGFSGELSSVSPIEKAKGGLARQVIRDKTRQGLNAFGRLLKNKEAIVGGLSSIGSYIVAPTAALAVGATAIARLANNAKNVKKLNSNLANALQRPTKALEILDAADEINNRGASSNVEERLVKAQKDLAVKRKQVVSPERVGVVAGARGAALQSALQVEAAAPSIPMAQPTPSATPTPTATPTAAPRTFSDILKEASDIIIPPAEAAERVSSSKSVAAAQAKLRARGAMPEGNVQAKTTPGKLSLRPQLTKKEKSIPLPPVGENWSQQRINALKTAFNMKKSEQIGLLKQFATNKPYDKLLKKVDPLTRAVIMTESTGDHAKISPVGAIGLMQIMPGTASHLRINPYDPEENVRGGSQYLRQMKDKYKDTDLALAAYNWGPGNMDRAMSYLKKKNVSPTFKNMVKYASKIGVPQETIDYVPRVKANFRK